MHNIYISTVYFSQAGEPWPMGLLFVKTAFIMSVEFRAVIYIQILYQIDMLIFCVQLIKNLVQKLMFVINNVLALCADFSYQVS